MPSRSSWFRVTLTNHRRLTHNRWFRAEIRVKETQRSIPQVGYRTLSRSSVAKSVHLLIASFCTILIVQVPFALLRLKVFLSGPSGYWKTNIIASDDCL